MDILTEMRYIELTCTQFYTPKALEIKIRNVKNCHGGAGHARCFGAVCPNVGDVFPYGFRFNIVATTSDTVVVGVANGADAND